MRAAYVSHNFVARLLKLSTTCFSDYVWGANVAVGSFFALCSAEIRILLPCLLIYVYKRILLIQVHLTSLVGPTKLGRSFLP